ncbi:MAG: hypothetical protein KZQ77_00005, partial [Candidatus Thiodiazotropha sp. (ex Notomyrtea botanica)]|nr:hypothetical protein [Candidatus Thiodiazotropha sp. (ex Notomyrtea botanica)]
LENAVRDASEKVVSNGAAQRQARAANLLAESTDLELIRQGELYEFIWQSLHSSDPVSGNASLRL